TNAFSLCLFQNLLAAHERAALGNPQRRCALRPVAVTVVTPLWRAGGSRSLRSGNAQAERATLSRPTSRRPDPLYTSIANGLRGERREDCVSGSWQHGIGDREPYSGSGASHGRVEPQSGK